jgi:hypothetical protein
MVRAFISQFARQDHAELDAHSPDPETAQPWSIHVAIFATQAGTAG